MSKLGQEISNAIGCFEAPGSSSSLCKNGTMGITEEGKYYCCSVMEYEERKMRLMDAGRNLSGKR